MSGGRFDVCVTKTLGHEGVFANHKADKGGKTKYGITHGTLRVAQHRGIVRRDVAIEDITVADAKAIYFALYWNPASCYELPAPLDLLLFDAMVNHRPGVAIVLFQQAIYGHLHGVDGVMGPDTVRQANACDRRKVIERYAELRKDLFHRIVSRDRTQRVFLGGWLNRVDRLKRQAVEELDGGQEAA